MSPWCREMSFQVAGRRRASFRKERPVAQTDQASLADAITYETFIDYAADKYPSTVAKNVEEAIDNGAGEVANIVRYGQRGNFEQES